MYLEMLIKFVEGAILGGLVGLFGVVFVVLINKLRKQISKLLNL